MIGDAVDADENSDEYRFPMIRKLIGVVRAGTFDVKNIDANGMFVYKAMDVDNVTITTSGTRKAPYVQ